MYISGASQTVVLNMSTLVWSIVTTVQGRVPLASEVHHLNFTPPDALLLSIAVFVLSISLLVIVATVV